VVYGKVSAFGITNDTVDQVLAWNLARSLAQTFNSQYVLKETGEQDWRNAKGTSYVWQTQTGFAQTVYKDKYPEEFDQAINTMIDETASGQVAPATAIDKAANQINQLVKATNK
jgi:uncharacterized protein (DUF885 family)